LKYTFLGLRFEPKVVLELAPTAIGDQEGEPEPSPPRHAGGRPRKDFWEPLLVAAGIAIYAGWQPQRIADVERWMADWLADNEHEAAEVGIRQRARILFNAYAAERDKN
jgi:hypothetical protein